MGVTKKKSHIVITCMHKIFDFQYFLGIIFSLSIQYILSRLPLNNPPTENFKKRNKDRKTKQRRNYNHISQSPPLYKQRNSSHLTINTVSYNINTQKQNPKTTTRKAK